jgi:aspartyl-tRNA(Asn)/glutamyl-tRNA(Gln) amidotransferase subunit A
LPALSVPCGFTDDKLPVGLQFVGKPGNDAAVIRAARVFQQRTDWHRKHPKVI